MRGRGLELEYSSFTRPNANERIAMQAAKLLNETAQQQLLESCVRLLTLRKKTGMAIPFPQPSKQSRKLQCALRYALALSYFCPPVTLFFFFDAQEMILWLSCPLDG
ncbi:hypothetical protein Q3G72_012376 [Acer saccharum]|nr:hypothetical protein Q3G72_012376 [Acer saccharum]